MQIKYIENYSAKKKVVRYKNSYIFHISAQNIDCEYFIATDKGGIYIIFFLFLHENICCGYSLEAPQHISDEKSALSVAMGTC